MKGKKKVLIAEDNAELCNTLAAYFRERDEVEVLAAQDQGEAAICLPRGKGANAVPGVEKGKRFLWGGGGGELLFRKVLIDFITAVDHGIAVVGDGELA